MHSTVILKDSQMYDVIAIPFKPSLPTSLPRCDHVYRATATASQWKCSLWWPPRPKVDGEREREREGTWAELRRRRDIFCEELFLPLLDPISKGGEEKGEMEEGRCWPENRINLSWLCWLQQSTNACCKLRVLHRLPDRAFWLPLATGARSQF